MFFRRRLVFDQGLFFEPRWRAVGDGEWMVRLLQRQTKMAALGKFTSVFTCTGANMSAGENARRERRKLFQSAPAWARTLKPMFILHHRLRRLFGGMYAQKPFSYDIFTLTSPDHRQRHEVKQPTFRSPT